MHTGPPVDLPVEATPRPSAGAATVRVPMRAVGAADGEPAWRPLEIGVQLALRAEPPAGSC